MINILVADDEKEIVELVELYLTQNDTQIYKAYDGKMAMEIIEKEDIHLAILDIMMPGLNGFQLVKEIRKTYNMPLIILSARDEFSDKIFGLNIGADDYMTKPFNPLELNARVDAQLRRFYDLGNGNKETDKEIQLGDLLVNPECYTVYKKNEQLQLTSTEYKILVFLLENIGRVYTKKQIFEHVWEDYYYDDENAIRVHISNLRDKIEDNPKCPKYLITVRGLGYKIERGSPCE
jgi:DNA-binding response OmpR family regulator